MHQHETLLTSLNPNNSRSMMNSLHVKKHFLPLVFLVLISPVTALSQPGVSYQWANRIGGMGADNCYSVALDSAGNIYVTGIFALTIDFDNSTEVNTMVSTGYQDLFFAKYDNNGNYLWSKQIHASGSWEVGNDIVVTEGGTIYLTGTFQDTADFDPGAGTANIISVGNSRDLFFACYDTDGNYVWAKRLGSSNVESGSSIAVDGSGNILLSGYFKNSADFNPGAGVATLSAAGEFDIFFAKYDANGNYILAKRIGSGQTDRSYSIDSDSAGNIYITGGYSGSVDFDPDGGTALLTGPSLAESVFFAKYDSNGSYVWAKNVSGPTTASFGNDIFVDAAGNVYVTGRFWQTGDFDPSTEVAGLTSVGNYDVFFAKYDGNGNYLWAKSIGSTNADQGKSIVADEEGNVYLAGCFGGAADFNPDNGSAIIGAVGDFDIFFSKYDLSGNYIWGKTVSQGNGLGINILTDPAGAIYLAGNFINTADFDPFPLTGEEVISAGGADFFFAKYLQIETECTLLNVLVSQAENVLTSSQAANYQWVNCAGFQPIEGDTNQIFTTGISGFYAVIVTQNSCVDTSGCFEIIVTGISDFDSGNDIIIFPNPSAEEGFQVDLPDGFLKGNYKLIDFSGRTIFSGHFDADSVKMPAPFCKGIYLLRIESEKGSIITKKVVRN